MNNPARRFPMNKPEGFKPGVQRYSAEHPQSSESITVLLLGIQNKQADKTALTNFHEHTNTLLKQTHGPVLFDFAQYSDPQGYATHMAVAYWYSKEDYRRWQQSSDVQNWWQNEEKQHGSSGYFWESFTSSISHTETIAFKEFVRGLSGCPMSNVKPMGESGYWGAARDRMPASANETLESALPALLPAPASRITQSKRCIVPVPKNLTLIRSGVSWSDCGDEQLESYVNNLIPVLNEGMEYLRQNPIESGCFCMRQVESVTHENESMTENYCAGYFLSLRHLEQWAKKHPTHLAIYGNAQKERMKYKDKLELRTYHEVYVIDQSSEFEYVNCHPQTGILPFSKTQ